MDEQREEELQAEAEAATVSLDKLYKDLNESLAKANDKAYKAIEKIGDPDKGKPSKQALFKAFSALFELVQTKGNIEQCSMAHIRQMLRSSLLQGQSLVAVLRDRSLVTSEELEAAGQVVMADAEESSKRAKEESEKQSLTESLAGLQGEEPKDEPKDGDIKKVNILEG